MNMDVVALLANLGNPWLNGLTTLLFIASVQADAIVPKQSQPLPQDLPRVLIIGDSISIGYTPYLKELLREKAAIVHHRGNAEHTGTGLKKLDEWLGAGNWDVIQFNWGLWDLCYRHPDSKVQGRRDKERGTLTTTETQYAQNLELLVSRLKQTNAQLIWANTTIVPAGEAGRKEGDDLRYNEIAHEIMARSEIPITDLNTLSRSFGPDYFIAPGNVHFTAKGYDALAHTAKSAIEKALQLTP